MVGDHRMLGILAARLEEAGWQDKLKGAANGERGLATDYAQDQN